MHRQTQAYTQAHTYTYVHDMHACNGFSYWQKHRIYVICRKIDATGDNHSKRIKSAAEKHYTFCIHGYYILYNRLIKLSRATRWATGWEGSAGEYTQHKIYTCTKVLKNNNLYSNINFSKFDD